MRRQAFAPPSSFGARGIAGERTTEQVLHRRCNRITAFGDTRRPAPAVWNDTSRNPPPSRHATHGNALHQRLGRDQAEPSLAKAGMTQHAAVAKMPGTSRLESHRPGKP